MIRTSYGVRFFDFAYARFSFAQFVRKAFSCEATSCGDVVRAVKS
jgi:hypothetical protein